MSSPIGAGRPGPSAAEPARYHRFAPRPGLGPWLARLWVQEGPAQEAPPTTVLPSGQVELIVRYRDPFVHVEGERVVTVPAVCALGQRTRPLRAAATGATGLVIAGLHPWAGDALLGEDVSSLTDRCVDLADVLGRAATATLEDRVASAPGPEARARAVEDFLARLVSGHALDALALACAGRIRARAGRVSVAGLAAELHVSDRHLRRRVTRAVGIGPKGLARLVRAQRALDGLRCGQAWTRVALEGGYADQAHLTRELKAFTGRTPGQLSGAGDRTPLMRSFNTRASTSTGSTIYL